MELFLNTTELLIAFWIGFGIVMLSLVMRSNLGFSRKLAIVPLTFLALYVTISNTTDLLGLPYDAYPEGKMPLLMHKIAVDPKTKQKSILLWVLDKGRDRLFRIPFTEKGKKQLAESKKRRKKGRMQMIEMKKAKKKQFYQTSPSPSMNVYNFPLQDVIPKTPE